MKTAKRFLSVAISIALTFTFGCTTTEESSDGYSYSSCGNEGATSGGTRCPNASTTPVNSQGIGSVTCGGQTYKTVNINGQIWMAENLNYIAIGSVCGGGWRDGGDAGCDKYGRLYNWSTAVAGAASSIASPSGVQGICPDGWHLPSKAEWDALTTFVESDQGCSNCAANHLRATVSWDSYYNRGLDTYGFTALPGGGGTPGSSGSNYCSGPSYEDGGFWWSASEYNANNAYYQVINYNETSWDFGSKLRWSSVRCVKDN